MVTQKSSGESPVSHSSTRARRSPVNALLMLLLIFVSGTCSALQLQICIPPMRRLAAIRRLSLQDVTSHHRSQRVPATTPHWWLGVASARIVCISLFTTGHHTNTHSY